MDQVLILMKQILFESLEKSYSLAFQSPWGPVISCYTPLSSLSHFSI